MKPQINNLTDRDRRLFDHAVTRVSEESGKLNLKDVKVSINFVDREHLTLANSSKPKNCFVVSYDGEGKPQGIWETESFERITYRLITMSINDFFRWVNNLTIAAVGKANEAMLAIKY